MELLYDALLGILTIWLYFYDAVTYVIYVIIYQPWKQKSMRNKLRMELIDEIPNQEKTFRTLDTSEPAPVKEAKDFNLNTLEKLFKFAIKKHSGKPALGTRKILAETQEKQPDGKYFTKFKLANSYSWITYKEFGQESSWFGSGLREIGAVPKDKIGIFAETKAEWLISALGCFKNNFGLVTIYPNLGVEGLMYGFLQTNVEIVITSAELFPKVLEIADKLPSLKKIIYFNHSITNSKNPSKNHDTFEIYSYDDVIERGRKSSIPECTPKSEDIAIIMYTSGSTGVPKGVFLSHGNITSAIYSIAQPAIEILGDESKPDDAYLSFLPLAHVLELIIETSLVLFGVKVGYSRPTTLTDLSTSVIRSERGDASILKPTVMAAVPLVLDRVYKGLNTKLSRFLLAKKFIEWAYNYRLTWLQRGFDTPILNKLVFQKLKNVIGGKLKVMFCGGAPLASHVHSFVQTCLDTKIIIGYGSTETCATACSTNMHDLTTERVGAPLPGVEIKLVNWEEGHYFVDGGDSIRGEILVNGASCTDKYFENPELTSQDFVKDKSGNLWFRTGDIGEVMEENMTLRVIDRKKDLVKLQFGEYVSLGKVESYYKTHPLVDNFCAYSDPMRNCVVGLCVPDPVRFKELAIEQFNGRKSELNRKELCQDEEVNKYFMSILSKEFSSNLLKFEVPKSIELITDLWTPESNLLTASMKLKRRAIYDKYKSVIEHMYNKLDEKVTNELVRRITNNVKSF